MSLELPAEMQVFSTCPSSTTAPTHYAERVAQTTRWSEAAGLSGLLIYTDNSLVDPWLVAQIVIQNSDYQVPLVAVQPVYMHPYTVAKKIASLAFLYGRRVCLNMVAGGFKNDLAALNDTTPHDSRYERLSEYTMLIRRLLEGAAPVSLEGRFYRVSNLRLEPRLAAELMPDILVSGSSEAGLATARTLGAIAVKYPEPPGQTGGAGATEDGLRCGVRIGIVAREDDEEAWRVALERFPDDRKGRMTRLVATKISDSKWHGHLSRVSQELDRAAQQAEPGTARNTYWLHPFENYQTNCPYLVGGYMAVATELSRYVAAGFRTFIMDIPATEEELMHAGAVLQLAARMAARNGAASTSAAAVTGAAVGPGLP